MGDCIGVDVSKHHFDWTVGGEGSVDRVTNTPTGVRRLVALIGKLDVELIVVESTGGYERPLTVALSEADLPVVLVNPWRVRRFGEGLGILAKPIRSTLGFSRSTGNGLAQREGRSRVPGSASWPISSGGAGS